MTQQATGEDPGAALPEGGFGTEDDRALDALLDMANPQPRYERWIEDGGLFCPVDGFAVAAGRNAVDEVLRHPELFTSQGVVQLGNIRPLHPVEHRPARPPRLPQAARPALRPQAHGRH